MNIEFTQLLSQVFTHGAAFGLNPPQYLVCDPVSFGSIVVSFSRIFGVAYFLVIELYRAVSFDDKPRQREFNLSI